MCRSLSLDFELLRKWLRRSVLNGPRKGESNRKVKMGPEGMTVGIRSWRQVNIPHLLRTTLFGRCFKKFGEFEERQYGRGGSVKKKLFHISSHSRLKTYLL